MSDTPRPRRILVIRLSSIGDVVLTTPILRAIRSALPEAELHVLTKPAMADVLRYNPHISRLHELEVELSGSVSGLRASEIDYVVDLQGSLRSRRIVRALDVPHSGFPKMNWEKYRMVHRWIPGPIPEGVPHIVTRYAEALLPLGIELDEEGLEVYPSVAAETTAKELVREAFGGADISPLGIVLGATHGTKRWPIAYHRAMIERLGRPVIVFGGKGERESSLALCEGLALPHLNAVGRTSLLESTALLGRCSAVVTHDTGLMHIAAALQVPALTLWGSTVPGFGMTPYKSPFLVAEVIGLDCRPCSKIGYPECPQGHFRCMRDLSPDYVAGLLLGAGWLT
jgi:ADP-heptose:LPS heptosyltransferase